MEITRLNGDSSWLLRFENTKILLDPWLLGEQVDLAPWFSRQNHTKDCFPVEQLNDIDAIVISHPFTDHCHEATLKHFSPDIPVIAPKVVINKIKSWKYFKNLNILESKEFLNFLGVEIHYLTSKKILDLTHQALYFKSTVNQENLFYTPHGFWAGMLRHYPSVTIPTDVLICTFTEYRLPFYLGGMVNFGQKNALELLEKLSAKFVIPTHDEKKESEGLVSNLAKVSYADNLEEILNRHQIIGKATELKIGETMNLTKVELLKPHQNN